MSAFQVTSSQLLSKAEELTNLNSQFKTQVGTLEETELSLCSMWEGEAKNAFHTQFQKDKTQFDNFFNAIQVYVQTLQSIAQKYAQAEQQNVDVANTRTGG